MEGQKRNQDIIREIWHEEVPCSKMAELKDKFASGLGISFKSVEHRVNGMNATNDFEFIMMTEIMRKSINLEKWESIINDKKSKYGFYGIQELR